MATGLQFIRNKSDFDDEAIASSARLRRGVQGPMRRRTAHRGPGGHSQADYQGERDPTRLRKAGLAALGYDREVI
jgi:hypothetical protein